MSNDTNTNDGEEQERMDAQQTLDGETADERHDIMRREAREFMEDFDDEPTIKAQLLADEKAAFGLGTALTFGLVFFRAMGEPQRATAVGAQRGALLSAYTLAGELDAAAEFARGCDTAEEFLDDITDPSGPLANLLAGGPAGMTKIESDADMPDAVRDALAEMADDQGRVIVDDLDALDPEVANWLVDQVFAAADDDDGFDDRGVY